MLLIMPPLAEIRGEIPTPAPTPLCQVKRLEKGPKKPKQVWPWEDPPNAGAKEDSCKVALPGLQQSHRIEVMLREAKGKGGVTAHHVVQILGR